jgi:hypothetical protein
MGSRSEGIRPGPIDWRDRQAPRFKGSEDERLRHAMADIQSPRLLYLKGALFLGLGILASAILLIEHPSVKTAALLALAVWAFARAYYFAFYVIEHYIDGDYKYAGLASFLRYVMRRGKMREAGGRDEPRDSPRIPT